jgi:hypothetical protein
MKERFTRMDGQGGKISEHFQGLGTVTREMVLHRAMELARINGHDHHTEDDWQEAKAELMGIHSINPGSEQEDVINALTRWDEDPGTSGHRVEPQPIQDENTFAEQLVQDGASEAEHDRMVQGSRSDDV